MSDVPLAELEAAMQRRVQAMPARLRPFTTERGGLPRAFVLSGARGVGKTTFLLHGASATSVLHVSVDNPLLTNIPLYELGRAAFMAGYRGVAFDEVHFAKDWGAHLKALYDDFPEHSVWASDSSSLALRGGIADLSRRYVPIHMPLMSFREFLYLESGTLPPTVDPFPGGMGGSLPRIDASLLEAFRRYRSGGTRPFHAEGDFRERMLAVLEKSLYADVPFFLPNVGESNLRLMNAIVATLARSAVPRLQVRSLCADWNVGADRLYALIEVMEAIGLLRVVRFENDAKARSIGAKLFFADPAFYGVLGGNAGTMREALVTMLCAESGWLVEAAREETTGDFVITRRDGASPRRFALEVGGASKRRKGSDFVIRDDLDFPTAAALPLWTLGMMY
ncbi:MAG: ATP-binding protein [Spirochaetales bacterium]|nr:ATP-binding protein [Spirochaetales bacterium]